MLYPLTEKKRLFDCRGSHVVLPALEIRNGIIDICPGTLHNESQIPAEYVVQIVRGPHARC